MMRWVLLCCLLSASAAVSPGAETITDDPQQLYLSTIKPLLARGCQACHGALAQEAGLRLDTAAAIRNGGDSGPAVVAGDHTQSMLISRVTDSDPATRMPPEGEGEALSAAEIDALAAWIDAGCPAPIDEQPEADPRDHWAFSPRLRPAIPAPVHGDPAASHPIDLLLAERLSAAGIAPQPEASREVLVRRVYLDLIGMPPSPEELWAISAAKAPDWYDHLVEQLLADPRYGQRWARHWMDIWRYSDWWGLGDQLRNSQKHMWHFRDWIVESLNDDVGYDEMVRMMLAADELAPDDLQSLRATGFLARNWFLFNRTPWMDDTVEHVGKALLGLTTNCAKCHDHKYDPISQEDYYRLRAFFEPLHVRMDMVPGEQNLDADGIPRVFDALLEAPTYRLIRGNDAHPDTSQPLQPGVPAILGFAPLSIEPVSLPKSAVEPARRGWVLENAIGDAQAAVRAAEGAGHEQALALAKARLTAVERRVEASRAAWAREDAPAANTTDLDVTATTTAQAAVKAEREVARLLAWGDMTAINEKLATATSKQDAGAIGELEKELAAARTKIEQATAAVAEPGEDFTRFIGARWTPTRFTHSGSDDPSLPFPATSSGRRTALARWITDPGNPLTARVAANHIWARHVGQPLVATVFDFGRNGTAPTHPELLDYLACELVDSGWSMKHLHRLIMTSAAYKRGSSTAAADHALAIDPDNRLLWRHPSQRLEAQVIRDCVLATAGMLDTSAGGPPVPASEQPTSRRRSLYFWHSDISRSLFLTTFDDAGVKECYRREESIVPQQALALANDAILHEAAAAIAASIRQTEGADSDHEIFFPIAFRRVLLREPQPAELTACSEAISAWQALEPEISTDTLQQRLVWALLNHTDFVTLR